MYCTICTDNRRSTLKLLLYYLYWQQGINSKTVIVLTVIDFRDSSPRAKYNATLDFELNESILGRVTKLIKRAFPTVPVFPTTGNHDYFPKHQFPPHGNELYNRLFNRWKTWIGLENEATFRKGKSPITIYPMQACQCTGNVM